jgi:hypothetical protein
MPIWLNHDHGDWGSCGYIGGGCIFQSGGMHADIFNSQIIFKKSSKLKWTHPLTKLNTIRVAMSIIFGSGGNVYVVKEPF